MSEEMLKRFPDKMRFLIGNEMITATDLKGVTLLSISPNQMIDFADTKAHDTVGDNFRLGEDDWNDGDESCGVGLFVYVSILLALDQFHSPLHIFEIAWMEVSAAYRFREVDAALLTLLKVFLDKSILREEHSLRFWIPSFRSEFRFRLVRAPIWHGSQIFR